MGFRFSIEHANWLANVLQPSGSLPELDHDFERSETLRMFIKNIEKNFYGSRSHREELHYRLMDALHDIDMRHPRSRDLNFLREFFKGTPWIALLIPSGNDYELDDLLTEEGLLRHLVDIRPDDPGLILQLENPPSNQLSLDSVFPAFKVALSNASNWPGLLVWTPEKDAAFFPLTTDRSNVIRRLEWIMSHLAMTYGYPNLGRLKDLFDREIDEKYSRNQPLNLIHLSDIHLGSKTARRRTSRVQRLIALVAQELEGNGHIVPVVTGDLMDTPSEDNLDDLRIFMEQIGDIGTLDPLVVLGNHDVRKDGWLNPKFEQAVNISRTPVEWVDECEVGIVSFNSVRGGHLARGLVGERELIDVGSALDAQLEKSKKYGLVGLVHHHPIPVDRPDWYKQKWYEKFLGKEFEQTEELEDAEVFLSMLKQRNFCAILHGHKYIPRFDTYQDMAVIGCGSTVGHVDTVNKHQTYMSINVVTIDTSTGQLACRQKAERIPGAGLISEESNEMLYRTSLT